MFRRSRKARANGAVILVLAVVGVLGTCVNALCPSPVSAPIIIEIPAKKAVEPDPLSACEITAACQENCLAADPVDEIARRQCTDACTNVPGKTCSIADEACSCDLPNPEPARRAKRRRTRSKKHHAANSDDPLDGVLKAGVKRHKVKHRNARLQRSKPAHRGTTCCKYCSNSQPCGNSCISWGKTCHKSGGCAC